MLKLRITKPRMPYTELSSRAAMLTRPTFKILLLNSRVKLRENSKKKERLKVDSKRTTERNNRTSKEPPLKMTVNTESNKKSKLSTEPKASKNISKTTAKNSSRSLRLANKNITKNKNTTKTMMLMLNQPIA